MYYKEHIAFLPRRLFLMLRSIGWAVWIPPVILHLLLPLLQISEYRQSGLSEELFQNIQQTTTIFVPLFAGWWTGLYLRNVTEVNGGEVLYLGRQKRLFRDVLLLFLVYMLAVSAQYAVYIRAFAAMRMEYVKILFPCLFLFTLVFYLGTRTKSVAFAQIVAFFYILADFLFSEKTQCFPFYSAMPGTDFTRLFLMRYLPMLLCSGLLLGLGLRRRAQK